LHLIQRVVKESWNPSCETRERVLHQLHEIIADKDATGVYVYPVKIRLLAMSILCLCDMDRWKKIDIAVKAELRMARGQPCR
jgi:hypothetical protein